jgi:hypothetical protein
LCILAGREAVTGARDGLYPAWLRRIFLDLPAEALDMDGNGGEVAMLKVPDLSVEFRSPEAAARA